MTASEWPLPDADINSVHDLVAEQKDYLRRIHWWVRLFGILWIVVPVVAAALAAVFFVAAVVIGGAQGA